MSRDIQGEISVGTTGVKITGKFVSQFKAPLILEPCQHLVSQRESLLKKEVWTVTIHGKADGSSSIKQRCIKLGAKL